MGTYLSTPSTAKHNGARHGHMFGYAVVKCQENGSVDQYTLVLLRCSVCGLLVLACSRESHP